MTYGFKLDIVLIVFRVIWVEELLSTSVPEAQGLEISFLNIFERMSWFVI